MLRYVMLVYVMLCYVTVRYVTLCYVTVSYVMGCYTLTVCVTLTIIKKKTITCCYRQEYQKTTYSQYPFCAMRFFIGVNFHERRNFGQS